MEYSQVDLFHSQSQHIETIEAREFLRQSILDLLDKLPMAPG
jgi:hypothetical protein